jgi:hypothetical protein
MNAIFRPRLDVTSSSSREPKEIVVFLHKSHGSA